MLPNSDVIGHYQIVKGQTNVYSRARAGGFYSASGESANHVIATGASTPFSG